MKSVKQILEGKTHKVLSVAPHVSVFDALQIMADKNVGALVVLDGDKLVGKSSKDTQVRDIMTTRVLCATPERTVEQCLALMTDKRVRHLPVIDHKKVIGVISIGDMVKEMLAEQQFVIAQLESYIHQ